MTTPSKMTDAELRLAIAEVVAKVNGWIIREVPAAGEGAFAFVNDKGELEGFAPDYPSDNDAAMELPRSLKTYGETERFGQAIIDLYMINHLKGQPAHIIEQSQAREFPLNATEIGWLFREALTPRMISEAYLTARRNDG